MRVLKNLQCVSFSNVPIETLCGVNAMLTLTDFERGERKGGMKRRKESRMLRRIPQYRLNVREEAPDINACARAVNMQTNEMKAYVKFELLHLNAHTSTSSNFRYITYGITHPSTRLVLTDLG